METRIAVFGAFGQLGVELCAELELRGYKVSAFGRARLDITDCSLVDSAIAEFEPFAVFNAAAYNMVDVAEREPVQAFENNALAVRNLAVACRKINARLIHFSTDYVFDGTLGRAYTELDKVHPLGAYAVSKLAGELYAQAYLDNAIVVRTSGVFGVGALKTARSNFPEVMLRLAKEGKPIRVVNDHLASPTFAPALASRSIDLLERSLIDESVAGVFHIGGGQPISWFDYAKLIFATAGLEPEVLATNDEEYRTPARRPKFSALDNARLRAYEITPMPHLGEAVAAYLSERAKHIQP